MLVVALRVKTLNKTIRCVNANPYRQWDCDLHQLWRSGARGLENDIEVGMVGINVPIPVPMAFFSFGGWKQSLFGNLACTAWKASISTRAPRR